MSRYTLELRFIEEDKDFILFPKDFPFYTDDETLRTNFIKKFYNEYRFREIGFETVGRFKLQLMSKLYNIMPYYVEYYKTILKANETDFMQTKDVTETFTREIEGTNEVNSTSNSNSTAESIGYDTPNSYIDDMTKYPTSGNKSTGTGQANDNTTGTTSQRETTTFHSKGNLGVSSDGFLIEKWREIIVDIDNMILGELEELFLQFF